MSFDNKPHILYIVPSAGIGGAETFIQHTALYHDKYRPVYAFLRDGILKTQLEEQGQICYLAPMVSRISRPLSMLQAIGWLKGLGKKYGVQLVHSTMAYGTFTGSFAARSLSIPHVWYQHGPVSGWMDQLAGVLYADRVFVNSAHTRRTQEKFEKNIRWAISSKRQIQRLLLGVVAPEELTEKEKNEIKNSRAELIKKMNLDDDAVLFAILCRPHPLKGIDLFIRALKEAEREVGRGKIAGIVWGGHELEQRDEYEKDLQELADKVKAPIFFAGETRQPLNALRSVDVLVNASIRPEGFGLSIIEAMHVRCAVIAPNEGGPVEIVRDGENGRVFEARSLESLRQALIDMCRNTSERNKMRERAYEEALELYQARSTIKKLEEIYDELLT